MANFFLQSSEDNHEGTFAIVEDSTGPYAMPALQASPYLKIEGFKDQGDPEYLWPFDDWYPEPGRQVVDFFTKSMSTVQCQERHYILVMLDNPKSDDAVAMNLVSRLSDSNQTVTTFAGDIATIDAIMAKLKSSRWHHPWVDTIVLLPQHASRNMSRFCSVAYEAFDANFDVVIADDRYEEQQTATGSLVHLLHHTIATVQTPDKISECLSWRKQLDDMVTSLTSRAEQLSSFVGFLGHA